VLQSIRYVAFTLVFTVFKNKCSQTGKLTFNVGNKDHVSARQVRNNDLITDFNTLIQEPMADKGVTQSFRWQ
jgi:hypothetical protein